MSMEGLFERANPPQGCKVEMLPFHSTCPLGKHFHIWVWSWVSLDYVNKQWLDNRQNMQLVVLHLLFSWAS